MKRLFLLIVLVGGYLGGMQDAHRRIAVLARHVAPGASEQAIASGEVAGQTSSYIAHVSTERVNESLGKDQRIKSEFDVSRYIPLIEAVSQVEEEYPEHYSFVHAHDKKIKVLHDLYAELMKLNGTPLREDWVPLRLQSDLCSDYVLDYLKRHNMKIEHDCCDEHQKNLLSVNFSVPGNLHGPESSLRYFATNHSVGIPANLVKKYLSAIKLSFEKDNSLFFAYIKNELSRIGTLLDSQEGVLVQILIPKKNVDKYVYLAHAGGRVVSEKIQLQDGTFLPGFDDNLKYYTRISSYLKMYEENIHQLDGVLVDGVLDGGQARIILHKDLYERADVVMKTHMYVSQEQLSRYQKEIRDLAQSVFTADLEQVKQLYVQSISKYPSINGLEFLSDCVSKRGQYYKEVLAVAQAIFRHTDVYDRRGAIELLKDLVEKGQYYKEALAAAQMGIKDADAGVRFRSFWLLESLVEKGQCYQEALAAAQMGIQDADAGVRFRSFELLKSLVKKGQYYQEALAAAQTGIQDANEYVRFRSFWLLESLVEKGQCYQEALAAAQMGIQDADAGVRFRSFELLVLLVRKGQCYQEALAAIQIGIKDDSKYVRLRVFEVLQLLFEKRQYYKEVLAAAQMGIQDADADVRLRSFAVLQLLVEKGQYYKEALVAAQMGIKDVNEDVCRISREIVNLVSRIIQQKSNKDALIQARL